METIWMGIAPGSLTTRVIAMAGPEQILLKAQLARDPRHPRALPTLLEAVALWQGLPVRAALCADGGGASCDSRASCAVTWRASMLWEACRARCSTTISRASCWSDRAT